jgi:hypothetical protein
MSNSNSLVSYNAPSNGARHMHNFTNRYLSESELMKPSKEVAGAITNATKQELNKIVSLKTEPAFVSIVFCFEEIFFSIPIFEFVNNIFRLQQLVNYCQEKLNISNILPSSKAGA